jgi:competence protein ComEC
MRILATFAGAFAAGVFLAQYLLPYDWLPACAAVAFVLACGRVALRGNAGRRVFLIGLGLCLAFGYDWLYVRQIQQPMEKVAGTSVELSMTVCDYAVPTNYGA